MKRTVRFRECITNAWPLGKRATIQYIWGWLGNKWPKFVKLKGRPQILFFAYSPVMVEHLVRYAEIFSEEVDRRPEFSIVFLRMPTYQREEQAAVCSLAEIRVCKRWKVPLIAWDLCVVADHWYPAELLKDDLPVLFIYHGLGAAKVYGGQNYKYGKRYLYDVHGRLKFEKMFESGTYQRRHAESINPELSTVISVVGDLWIDRFLDLYSRRAEIRHSLGYQESEVLVVIQSTWGDQSLESLMGSALFSSCRKLAQYTNYRFVISTHPNHWGGNVCCEDRTAYYLDQMCSGVKILRPEEDRLPTLAAADMCLTDITTLSTLFSFSGKPMAFLATSSVDIDPASELALLAKLYPTFQLGDDIEKLLLGLRSFTPSPKLKEFVSSLCDYPGTARALIREETFELIHQAEHVQQAL